MAQFTNQAQLSYNNQVTSSNVAVGEILEVLSVSKTALSNQYAQNSKVTYAISIVNSGTTAFTGLTVSDNMGAYSYDTTTLEPLTYVDGSISYFINGVLQAAPAVTSQSPLTFSNISVPAGGNFLIIYEARPNQFAPRATGSSIVNQVTVSGGGITPITAEETVYAESLPDLSITKAISPVPVTENGTLTYTFTIQNTVNTEAALADNVAVTDTFNPILSNLTVNFNGTAWTENTNYTYNEATGVFSTVAGQITVPAASYTQNADGSWNLNPGVSTLTVTGVI